MDEDEAWGWRGRGACQEPESWLFFAEEREPTAQRRVREARAKAVCGGCPVLALCRKDAVDRREPHGIWGGTSPRDRRELVVSDSA